MRSPTSEKILSETPQEVKDLVGAYGDLKVENNRLYSEIRDFKLLCRAYFTARSLARFSNDSKLAAEAVLKEAELEKRILSELEDFTRKDVEELPFKEKRDMKQLEIKKDGSVYIQPDNLFVENQMEGHHIVAKHHPETAINSTILCNPGIYPIPDLQWEVAKTCECGEHLCAHFGRVAILKESTTSTEQDEIKIPSSVQLSQQWKPVRVNSTEQESQEDLWRRVERYIDWPYQEINVTELMKQFTITRRKQ